MMFKRTLFHLVASSLLFVSHSYGEVTDGDSRQGANESPVQTNEVASFDVQVNTRLNLDGGGRGFSISSHGKIGQYCLGTDQYFTRDGRLGTKGRILEQELTGRGRSTPMKHLFFRNTFPGMENICPKFNRFNDKEKLNFWIWYFTAIASTESDCGRNEYNPNDPQGTSAGDLQLPERYSSRRWRGLISGAGGCEANPPQETPRSYSYRSPPQIFMAQTQNNLSCGVEILAGVLCGFYRNPIERCNSTTTRPYGNGFWRQIRTGINGTIIRDVKRLPICN